nr:MAG TPA: hypothetical protein [Caudoviricetes sp.]
MYDTITVGEYADYLERIAERMREVAESRPDTRIMHYTTVLSVYPASQEDALDMANILNITPEIDEYAGKPFILYRLDDGAYVMFRDRTDNQPTDDEQEPTE